MSIMLEIRPSLGPALVVGGGSVAARKVATLVDGGFAVTVVAPVIDAGIRVSGATLLERGFEPGDTDGYALVFACTDDREVNRRVGEECRASRTPVVVADSQEESTSFSPAVHRDGALMVGVATGGASPRLAQAIRDRIAHALGAGQADVAEAARVERAAMKEGQE